MNYGRVCEVIFRPWRRGRTGEVHDLKPVEAGLPAPRPKVGSRVVEGIAELNQHVQRHEQIKDVFAPRIINQRLNGEQGFSGR